MSDNEIKTSFTQNDYEIVKREVPYEGVFRMAKYYVKFRLFNGGFSDEVMREVMERSPAVGVLPYDPQQDTVILIEQFRAGAISNPQSPWLFEVVAGSFNANEKPIQVAYREMIEEAGAHVLDLYPICEYFVSPGACNEYLYLFCARINTTQAGIHGLKEEGEDIRSFVVPADKAFILLQEGKIKTSPTIIALQWLQLNRDWLRQLWLKK